MEADGDSWGEQDNPRKVLLHCAVLGHRTLVWAETEFLMAPDFPGPRQLRDNETCAHGKHVD